MKFNRYFFVIIYYFSAIISTASCNAMQDNKQLQNYNNHWLSEVKEIATVVKPRKVQYHGNSQVVISNSLGNCYKVNLKTQELPKKIGIDNSCQNAILQVDGEKMMICQGTTISGYDGKMPHLKSYLPKKFDKNIRSFAWNSLENTIFLCYGENGDTITRYNYVTDEKKEIFLSSSDQICQLMTMHPQKKVICLADYSGNISLRNVDDTLSKIKTIDLTKKLTTCWFCQYSPDGSCIILGNTGKIFIIDPNKNEESILLIESVMCRPSENPLYYENFTNMIFHPKNLILATLCCRNIDKLGVRGFDKKQLIRYWDIKTGKCIYESSKFDSDYSYDVGFSDDGFEGVVALIDKSVRVHVSFAIKDRCIYSLCVLNKLKDQNHWPQDIVRYCGNLLLASFKF